MPDSAKDERFLQSSVVAVVAHPDDETIGISVQLAKFQRSITVLQVTNGSPRDLRWAHEAGCSTEEEYAQVRQREMLAAMALVGVRPNQWDTLGYTDQEASFHLAAIARQLRDRLLQLQPKFVFTHPYEGGHPDHDACSFAVRAAVTLVEREGAMPPAILEFTSYNKGPNGIRTFEFLPGRDIPVTTIELDEHQRSVKLQMYATHHSQQRVLSMFPIGIERYRPQPDYDYTLPPHEGELYYEHHKWGLDGERFRSLVRAAQEELQLV